MDANLREDPAVIDVSRESTEIAAVTTNFRVVTEVAFSAASDLLKRIKGGLKRIDEARVRITGPMNEALRQVNAQAKEAAAPLLESETIIKRALIQYQDEQKRIQREQQRKADEAAARERARLQEIADRAAAKGQEAKAETFAARAEMIVPPVVTHAPPKVAGISTRTIWKFEIIDPEKEPAILFRCFT